MSKIIDGYRRQYVSFRQKMQGTAAIINPCKQSYYIQEVRGEIRRIYRPPVSASVCTKLYHGAAFLLAGALNALYGAFGRAPFMDTIQASACAAAIGVTVLCVLRWEKIKREEIVITVILEEGSVQVTLKALIDSGNSLYDPISGKPVCVVEREALEGKIPLDIPEKFRLIPYHSIGKKHGMMQAVEIEKLKVKKDGQELIVEKALLGLYENKVTAHGGYQMILHPALFENRRNGHDIKSRNTRKNAV